MASDGGEISPSAPPGGAVAGRYRITARLGRGGMGTVWQATDELLRRQVAVKELHLPYSGLSPRQIALRRERALREARSAALVRHPYVVVVHDVVEHEGHPWIVMELVDGRSLAHILERDGPLGPREAARVGAAVAGALGAAHACGIQHRDVKPANVLVERGTGRVVLTDFGIARVPGSSTISETGAFVGSPEYTAPERMSGRGAGPASDLWSLGALLCAAVHGESPFRRDSIGEIVHAVAIDDIVPPETLGPLVPVVGRLLDRDPDGRMSAGEAQRLLAGFAETGEPPVLDAVAGPGPKGAAAPAADAYEPSLLKGSADPPRAQGRRSRGLRVAAVGALVVVAVGAGVAANMLVDEGGDMGTEDGAASAPTATATATATPPGGYPLPPGGGPPLGGPFPSGYGPPPGAPGTPPLPQGYHLVSDPTHFSVALPAAYVRESRPPRTYYWSPDHTLRFGERDQRPDPRGPYAVLKALHAAAAKTYAGYRDGVVTATVQHGQPAALWEFTYGGSSARRMFEVCWSENGRMYDISLSAPVGQATKGRGVFDTARSTFWPG